MLELNKVYLCDVMEGISKLDDNSIDLVVTSPPYNKKGFLGKKGKSKQKSEDSMWNQDIQYDNFDDDLNEDVYRQQQIDLLNALADKIKDNGSIFYNHKARIKKNEISLPWTDWVKDSKLKLRQVIIWNRGGSVNVNESRFLPNTEIILWLTKSNKNVRFQRQGAIGEVWNIAPDTNNSHPAPYSEEMVTTIIKSVLGDTAMQREFGNLIVLDPYMGSGTTAVAAKKLGCDFIGFDMSPKYVTLASKRIAEVAAASNNSIWDNI